MNKTPKKQDPDSDGYRSPLWMITREPRLNRFVQYLQAAREEMEESSQEVVLRFSRRDIETVRREFSRMIRRGEEHLHLLAQIITKYLSMTHEIQSVVIGEIPSTGERFTLSQQITSKELYSTIDLDLGNRQLRKLRFFDGGNWVVPTLVSNVVDYQALEINDFGVYRIMTRVKAEEEIWNKVVDELFGLDALVSRDKQLVHLSPYVKDIFGLKVVVADEGKAFSLLKLLETVRWDSASFADTGIADTPGADRLQFLETKNYLSGGKEKGSGWKALKSVVIWANRTFEIQIQPLKNYLREREHLTKESHTGFKMTRESVRNEVARKNPLFGFYRDLLKWVFMEGRDVPPEHPGVTVLMVE
jgi:hypothetical protein